MGEKWKQWDFIFLGSKITVNGYCSHEIKRHLLLGRKAMTNLDSGLKSKDISLPTKVHIVKAMVFPVVTYGCERWVTKKSERWGTDAFELWYWRIVLSPLDFKEINPVNPNRNHPWIFIAKTDAEAAAPVLWLPNGKSWSTGKDHGAGKGEGAAQDEMVKTALSTQWTWIWANSGR